MTHFDPMPTHRHIEALRWNASMLRKAIDRNPDHPDVGELIEQEAAVNAEIKQLYDELRSQSRFAGHRGRSH